MSDLRVVCLSGVSGSGKDTVAKILDLYYKYKRIAQADSIRSVFDDLDSWEIRKDFDGTRGEPGEERSRDITVAIGTQCISDVFNVPIDCSVLQWTASSLAGIRYLNHYHIRRYNKFVISDVRFPSQYDLIKNAVDRWGGKILSIAIEDPSIISSGDITETEMGKIRVDSRIYNKKDRGRYTDSIRYLSTVVQNIVSQHPEFM